MRMNLSRLFLMSLLLGWALSHATVLGQDKTVSAIDKLRQGLDKTITVDYAGQTLAEVLKHLQDKTGVPIDLDPMASANMAGDPLVPPGGAPTLIKIKATNEKASQVLRRFLNVHCLSYVILDHGVFVSHYEDAIARQYLQRVNVAVEDVPFKKAVRDLAKKHGINLMIDPKMMKQADTAVSVELDNVSLETAVRMLAELANLKTARMGNAVFITSEEKAKKMREEEQSQFDNPLNGPTGPNSMRASGVNGGFGMAFQVGPNPPPLPFAGQVMPAVQVPAPVPAPGNAPPGGVQPQPPLPPPAPAPPKY